MIYDEITVAFQKGRADAELLLHETVEEILGDHWCDRIKLDKIRCAYAAAKAGQAARSVEMGTFVHGLEHLEKHAERSAE